VLFSEAVLQAVFPIAVLAMHAGISQGIDQGLACGTAALLCGHDGGFPGGKGVGNRVSDAVTPSVACPFASVSTFMRSLAAVVEAKGVVAGEAAKWEEV